MARLDEHGPVDPIVEVVRLHKDAMTEEESYRREFAFMSDGTVFTRVTDQEGGSRGWSLVPQTWKYPEDLDRLAANQKAKGWTAIWHPAYDPALKEFTRFVPAAGLLGSEGPIL
jgi:hypothetical protein